MAFGHHKKKFKQKINIINIHKIILFRLIWYLYLKTHSTITSDLFSISLPSSFSLVLWELRYQFSVIFLEFLFKNSNWVINISFFLLLLLFQRILVFLFFGGLHSFWWFQREVLLWISLFGRCFENMRGKPR